MKPRIKAKTLKRPLKESNSDTALNWLMIVMAGVTLFTVGSIAGNTMLSLKLIKQCDSKHFIALMNKDYYCAANYGDFIKNE